MKITYFSNNHTIRIGWMEHFVNFYNMLANNSSCYKWAVALGPFKTHSMHDPDLGWMIARCHESNVKAIWV
jgi:hypothetical protein